VTRTKRNRGARALRDHETEPREHEVASEQREAGGGVSGEREAGNGDEHVPRIGRRTL
jgi:hypothetical protein